MAAIKALEQWCRIQCDGYRDVAINNMTTSFRDGLAFCALIHKFRPDLINFDSLSKDNVYDNNNLAFRVAEDHLGIPALLDAEDMVALRVPDRLSILTYVSQYYNYFNGRSPIGGVGGLKRPAEGSKEEPSEKKNLPVVARTYTPKTPTENHPPPSTFTQRAALERHAPSSVTSPKGKSPPKLEHSSDQKTVLVESSNKSGTLNSKCTVCKSHVHLVQRLLVDGKLYHRSCFKCSVCSGPLHPGGHRPGPEPGTLVCTSHQRVPPGPKLPVQPGQRISCTPAEEGPKGENNARSAPRHVSVLSAPVRVGPKPVEPAPPPQPWTPSAQKTQAARQRFFQSPVSTPQAAPAESSGTQSSTAWKAEDKEKERARALISRKLSEGNCNNNNTAYLSGLRVDRRLPSAEVAWRQGNGDEKPAGGKPTRLSPTPPAASPSRSIPNNKESLWLAAISRERARPPSAVLSRARAKDMDVCEASAKCRSKLTPAPNEAENQTPAAEMATVALENSSNICKTHHLSLPHTPSSQTASSSDSSRISSPVTAKPPIPSQLQQASAVVTSSTEARRGSLGVGSKNGHLSSCSPTSDWATVVSITISPSISSSSTPHTPSPKPQQHGSAGLDSKNGGHLSYCSPTSDWKIVSIATSPSTSSNHKAPSPKQPQNGSAGLGSKNGDHLSSCSPSSDWTAAVSVSTSAGPSNHKAPSPKQPRRGSAGLGSKNGDHWSLCSPSSDWTKAESVSTSVSASSNHKAPSPNQPRHGSAGFGSKNGSISSSCSPASDGTPVVSITSSPSQPSNYKPPSPKQLHHGFADWTNQSKTNLSNGTQTSQSSSISISLSAGELSNHTAPSPKQPRRGSAECGSNSRNDSSPTNTSVSEIMPPTIKPHHVPVDQIAEELNEIERDLSELEKEGVELERRLRSCEEEGRGDILMDPLMVEWFNLIRRKQTYIRRESELMYIAKTQDLEEQQPGVEGELRRLMSKPENLKSATERRREAELMTRLVEIVNDRNAIVEGLEIDRLREEEEDQQLDEMMQRLGLKQSKKKRKSSISKLFRRRSKKTSAEE